MKKLMTLLILSLLVVIVLSTVAYADTVHYMCEPITTDTTWEGEGHIYYICKKETKNGWSSASEFSVEPGATLTIESGARVYMNYNADSIEIGGDRKYTWMDEMNIYGNLVADGVTFTDSEKQSVGTNKGKACSWKSINIYSGRGGDGKTASNGSGKFTNCTFSDGGVRDSVYYDSMINLKNGSYDNTVTQTLSLTLEGCTFAGFDMGNGKYGSGVECLFSPAESDHSYLTFYAKNCTFGSADAPLSRAFAVSATYDKNYSVTLDGCNLYSHVATPDSRGFLHAYKADRFCMKNCTVDIASPSYPIKANMDSFHPMELSNNEISLVLDGSSYSGNLSLSELLSGQPLKKLELKNNLNLRISYVNKQLTGLYYYYGFALAIADGGELIIGDGCSINSSYSSSAYSPNPILKLGKNATVSGLTLYQSDGTTEAPLTSSDARRFFLNTKSSWALEDEASTSIRSISLQTTVYDTENTQKILLASYKAGKLSTFTILEKPKNGWNDYNAGFAPSDMDEPDCYCAFFLNESFVPTGQSITIY